jgi:hypothetical protein
MPEETKKYDSDHDLLITLNVRVQDLIDTIKQMDGTISRDIGGLKEGKLDKSIYTAHCAEDEKDFEYVKKEFAVVWKKHDEHSSDIKKLSWIVATGIGIMTVIQFIMPFIIKKFI